MGLIPDYFKVYRVYMGKDIRIGKKCQICGVEHRNKTEELLLVGGLGPIEFLCNSCYRWAYNIFNNFYRRLHETAQSNSSAVDQGRG